MRGQRLSDDAHIGDAGRFDRIHDSGEGAEGHIFISADKDGLMLRVADFLFNPGGNFVDVDGVVAQKTRCCLLMLITRRSSVISFTVRVLGTLTSMPDCSTGAVTMKMISRTNTTSTSG